MKLLDIKSTKAEGNLILRHVSLTCKNHPELRWSTKECAWTKLPDGTGFYNSSRNIFFCGVISNPARFHSDKSGVQCEPALECNCRSNDLILSPEDTIIAAAQQKETKL